jgi:hypothetical protein
MDAVTGRHEHAEPRLYKYSTRFGGVAGGETRTAEHEAKMISERTKATLAAARARGVKLGGDRGARLTQKARNPNKRAAPERQEGSSLVSQSKTTAAGRPRRLIGALGALGQPTESRLGPY